MNDMQRRQAAKGSLVAFQANKFCPATSHLPQDYDQQIARLDGVKEVVPVQVFTNNCRASLDVVVFYGVLIIAFNFFVDLAYRWLDPRVKL